MAHMAEAAISMALKGHSFIITGCCGTGKTHTLKEIIKKLAETKHVAVTATTGMASIQIGMDGTTLHHWSGIRDGRYSLKVLADLFDNDDNYAPAKKRIISCDCLIIDEISMLSKRMLDMAEFVCRHVKQNNLCFGGIQVIGSGDFKQLPPVPNKFLDDDGSYCFLSNIFDAAFPHHVQLTKVIRQTEPDLVMAIKELCDGSPSDGTIQLLRGLNARLDVSADHVTRLYGTNFDVRYVNEEMLELLDGDVHVFKATDQGNRQLLLHSPAPKTLLLKEGAPVIVIKNLGGDLFNGQTGNVHKLTEGSDPVINIKSKLYELRAETFDVFDSSKNKVVASRKQLPIILSYAMTVHRSQGQTIENLEIDCSSFFAPGQLGVAVGRAVSKSGLSVQNFSLYAATLKHPDSVFNFYEKPFRIANEDLSCCNRTILDFDNTDMSACQRDESGSPASSDTDGESRIVHPKLECPYDINEFIAMNSEAKFVSVLQPQLISSGEFKTHIEYIYFNVDSFMRTDPTKTIQFVKAYKDLHSFLVGSEHLYAVKALFNAKIVTKDQNKFSSKLAFWLMDKKIHSRSSTITVNQPEACSSNTYTLSQAGSAKIRYIAGACIHKIRNRLRDSVERNIGRTGKGSKLTKKINFKKQRMLRALSISEDSIDANDTSLSEIQDKQNKSRGLTIVNAKVLDFFKELNASIQPLLSSENLNLNLDNIHLACRKAIGNSSPLLSDWINLFTLDDTEELEDEIVLILISELYEAVTEHFIKLAIVDVLKSFKRSIPRKKKQSLRTKIQALGERQSTTCRKRKADKTPETDSAVVCQMCDNVCADTPEDESGASIGCDRCNKWFHYMCVNLSGNEPFLTSDTSTWFCPTCHKGKGRGKKSKK